VAASFLELTSSGVATMWTSLRYGSTAPERELGLLQREAVVVGSWARLQVFEVFAVHSSHGGEHVHRDVDDARRARRIGRCGAAAATAPRAARGAPAVNDPTFSDSVDALW
jgi:hypothetical protein